MKNIIIISTIAILFSCKKIQEEKPEIDFLENEIINKNGCLIIEHDKRIKFDEKNTDVRKYGNVFFTMFNL